LRRRTANVGICVMLITALLLAACADKGNGANGANGENGSIAPESTAAGPANFNAEGYPIANETITLKMMGYKHPIQGPWEEMYFFKDMQKMTNIAFTFDTPPAESYEERKNLAFVSGQLPDVFFSGNIWSDEAKHGDDGVLIPLEDLIEKYAPNIRRMLEENSDIKRSITSPSGHIYSLPFINRAPNAVAYTIPWINGKWMQAVGITKVPETIDELYTLLKAFKEGDPNRNGKQDEIPLTSDKLNDTRAPLLAAFGHLSRGIEAIDGVVQYGAATEGYREYLQFMNKLFAEGLLDPETFTHQYADIDAKGKADRVGIAMQNIWQVAEGENDQYPALPVLTSSSNGTKRYPIGGGYAPGAFAITNTNKYPEATIRWVDYLYSEEGSLFLHYGKEGDLWEWADKEKGIRKYIQPASGISTEEHRATFTPDVGTYTPKWVRPESEAGWDDVGHQFRIKETNEKVMPYGQVPFPGIQLLPEEQSRLDLISVDLNTYVEQMEAKFIAGGESFDKWDDYLATLKKLKVDEFVEVYAGAYERWKSFE